MLSCCWQTARHSTILHQRAAVMHVILPNTAYTHHSIWRPQWGGSTQAIGFIFGMGNENGWATIWWKSHDDRLSRLGTIHQCDRHTDSHVAIAIAALTHFAMRQTVVVIDGNSRTCVCESGGAELAHSVFCRASVSMSQNETSLLPWTDDTTPDCADGLTSIRRTHEPASCNTQWVMKCNPEFL